MVNSSLSQCIWVAHAPCVILAHSSWTRQQWRSVLSRMFLFECKKLAKIYCIFCHILRTHKQSVYLVTFAFRDLLISHCFVIATLAEINAIHWLLLASAADTSIFIKTRANKFHLLPCLLLFSHLLKAHFCIIVVVEVCECVEMLCTPAIICTVANCGDCFIVKKWKKTIIKWLQTRTKQNNKKLFINISFLVYFYDFLFRNDFVECKFRFKGK